MDKVNTAQCRAFSIESKQKTSSTAIKKPCLDRVLKEQKEIIVFTPGYAGVSMFSFISGDELSEQQLSPFISHPLQQQGHLITARAPAHFRAISKATIAITTGSHPRPVALITKTMMINVMMPPTLAHAPSTSIAPASNSPITAIQNRVLIEKNVSHIATPAPPTISTISGEALSFMIPK